MARRKNRRKKEKKPSFVARMKARGRETAVLGRTLYHEPRSFPGALLKTLKRSFRTLWNARGGGLYACGFVVAFVWLEISTTVNEAMTANGVGAFLSDQLMDFVLRFTVQSIGNTVQAFLWPLLLIEYLQAWGLAVLLILYVTFPRYIKQPLSNWLFDDEPPDEEVSRESP
ncbi:MAG TPA: hypothetical protein VFE85_09285 [Woeseiaceae bacterium]|nr:hypothetical protein [Woeseiaceae bacterium]